MKKLITSSLVAAALIFASQANAQVENKKEVKTNSKSVTIQPKLNTNKVKDAETSVKKPAPKRKKTVEVAPTMPEKSDKKADKWRKDGLEKRNKKLDVAPVKSNKKSTRVMPEQSNRKFGEYNAWTHRTSNQKDEDWERLNDIISNKVNLPKESKAIIAKKRAELKDEYNANKISKKDYKQLSTELNYAEEDVEKIEVWVGGKK